MVQLTDPFAAVAGGTWSNYQAMLFIHTSGGGGFLYASVVDNATNDAFFVRGVKDLYAEAGGGLNETLHKEGWLLAAARAPGLEESIWRTDLWVNIQSVTALTTFQVRFCESGEDNSQAEWRTLPLVPGQTVYYLEDVVEQFLHVGGDPWVGALEYRCSTGAQVWARVYSISPDGAASYGQLIEGVPAADMSPPSGAVASTDEYQWMFAAKHTADQRFRVNVGIINPTAVACHYYVAMYTNAGDSDTYVEVDVPAYSMRQLTDPFANVDGGDWTEKQIRVQPSTPNAGGFGYLSVVDNATNDAFFVRGIKRLAYPTP